MSRCAKFHHLFDEVGNFCGMSASSISCYRAYRGQVKKIAAAGRLEEDFIFEHFTEAPSRLIARLGDEERTRALNYVTGRLANREKVTVTNLRAELKAWQAAGAVAGNEPRNSTIVKTGTTPPLPVETPAAAAPPRPPGAPATDTPLPGSPGPAAAPAVTGGTARFTTGTPVDALDRAKIIRPAGSRIVPPPLSREEAEALVATIVRRWFTKNEQAVWEELRMSGRYGDSDLAILEGLRDDAAGRLP